MSAFKNTDYANFLDLKRAFIRKHNRADWEVDTSSMDEYGRYTKTYTFSDGAQLFEVNGPAWETVEAEKTVHGVTVKLSEKVKFFRTETWNTEDAHSVYFFEKW